MLVQPAKAIRDRRMSFFIGRRIFRILATKTVLAFKSRKNEVKWLLWAL
jgi:hypothetical protein